MQITPQLTAVRPVLLDPGVDAVLGFVGVQAPQIVGGMEMDGFLVIISSQIGSSAAPRIMTASKPQAAMRSANLPPE
jgi:hypothetical protein